MSRSERVKRRSMVTTGGQEKESPDFPVHSCSGWQSAPPEAPEEQNDRRTTTTTTDREFISRRAFSVVTVSFSSLATHDCCCYGIRGNKKKEREKKILCPHSQHTLVCRMSHCLEVVTAYLLTICLKVVVKTFYARTSSLSFPRRRRSDR